MRSGRRSEPVIRCANRHRSQRVLVVRVEDHADPSLKPSRGVSHARPERVLALWAIEANQLSSDRPTSGNLSPVPYKALLCNS